jgi:hypothetical protein
MTRYEVPKLPFADGAEGVRTARLLYLAAVQKPGPHRMGVAATEAKRR